MSVSDWFVFVLDEILVELLTSWPFMVAVVLIVLRGQVAAAGRWLAPQLGSREFSATTPAGSFTLGPTIAVGPSASEADADALGEILERSDDLDARLKELVADSRRRLEELQARVDIWPQVEAQVPDAAAIRIAQRIEQALDDGTGFPVAMFDGGSRDFEFYEEEQLSKPKVKPSFLIIARLRADAAVIEIARSSRLLPVGERLSEDTATWSRAFQLLSERGIPVSSDLFSGHTLETLLKEGLLIRTWKTV